jgi:hypothetical protein
MRISERLILVCVLTSGLAGPALAFDGKAEGAIPAVEVDRVARGSLSSLPLAPSAAVAAPPGSTILPSASIPGILTSRPPDQPPKLSAVDAFRSGTQALQAGDTSRGVTALEYAAANGHAVAQWKLGRMYAEGDGVGRNDLRAFEYFRDIADAHADDVPGTQQARFVANAFVALGIYYLDGIPSSPIKADPDRARDMFQYAASYFGDPDAQYHLGRLYLTGRGAIKDPKLAARWFGLAANKGHLQAQALLGSLLFKGEVVPRQAALGLMWLTLASDAAGGAPDKWVRDLHDAAFKQASDDERQLALMFLERRLNGRRD